jgi:hypothetical protein
LVASQLILQAVTLSRLHPNMKKLSVVLFLVLLQGCSTMLPSFWDDNQSKKIIDVRQSVAHLNCAQSHLPQVKQIHDQLEWFQLYSESKGFLQNDVLAVIKPMQETVEEFYKRSAGKNQGSVPYCEMKKKILIKQSSIAAQAVLARF